jgi:hypothetical protein
MRGLVLSLATVGLMACATPGTASNATVDTQATSQATDFSSARVIYRDGRRHHGCRTVVVKRWHHGHRVVKRTRICR